MSQPIFFPTETSTNTIQGNLLVTGNATVDGNLNDNGTATFGTALINNLTVTNSCSLPETVTVTTSQAASFLGTAANSNYTDTLYNTHIPNVSGTSWEVIPEATGLAALSVTNATQAVKTKHNTLDDGTGSMSLAGVLTLPQINMEGLGLVVKTGGNSSALTVSNSGSAGGTVVSTFNNTLDDGSGNLVATGNITAVNAYLTTVNGTGSNSNYIDNVGNLHINGTGGAWSAYGNGATSDAFKVAYNNIVSTAYNTLDNGSGSMTVANGLTVGGTTYVGSTATNGQYMQLSSNQSSPYGSSIQATQQGVANNTLTLNSSGGAVKTQYNVLDDGAGNTTLNSQSTATNAATCTLTCKGTGSGNSNNLLMITSAGGAAPSSSTLYGGIVTGTLVQGVGGQLSLGTYNGDSSPAQVTTGLTLSNNGLLVTKNNTLDDGSGNATVAGTLTVGATTMTKGTASTVALSLPSTSGTLALSSQINDGTITSVATDSTMTGGPITTSGTLGVNPALALTSVSVSTTATIGATTLTKGTASSVALSLPSASGTLALTSQISTNNYCFGTYNSSSAAAIVIQAGGYTTANTTWVQYPPTYGSFSQCVTISVNATLAAGAAYIYEFAALTYGSTTIIGPVYCTAYNSTSDSNIFSTSITFLQTYTTTDSNLSGFALAEAEGSPTSPSITFYIRQLT